MRGVRWLPWAAAAASLAAAVGAWVSRPPAPAETRTAADRGLSRDAAPEIARLRRAVLLCENEGQVLRRELDRLRGLVELKNASDQRRAELGLDRLSVAERRERLAVALKRLPELSKELMSGRREVYEGMREVVLTMLNAPREGPEDAVPFREAYEASDDVTVRRLLLPHVLSRDPERAKAFLFSELARAEDPELRADMIESVRFVTDVGNDPEAQHALAEALRTEANPRARQAAVEALGASRSPEAEEALLAAASGDPDPKTRELAIRALAGNADTRQKVLELVGRESDERLRTVGECTARLAALDQSG